MMVRVKVRGEGQGFEVRVMDERWGRGLRGEG